ncbi:UDP-glucosyltransferase 2-like [Hetaerina americana]|uniref:UDP-glucosyltransferase 2-like n=1 Tax=Hetaerina americana TaxID=62018 RepID=UPI003A7F2733
MPQPPPNEGDSVSGTSPTPTSARRRLQVTCQSKPGCRKAMEYNAPAHRGGLLSILTLIILLHAEGIQPAKILGMFPLSTKSHNNVFDALTMELAARGHQLTVVTPHPIENPPANVTQIDVSRAVTPHFGTFRKVSVIKVTEAFGRILNITSTVCDAVLSLPEMRKLMDPEESGLRFDLMLISHFFSECFYPYAHIYNVPVVAVSPVGYFPYTAGIAGNVAPPSFVPNTYLSLSNRMNFAERTVNFVSLLAINLYTQFFMYPRYEKIAREHFGDVPNVSQLHRRTSLILLNNDFTYNYPRPLTPNIIEVGGLHIKSPSPLPKDLQRFMDEAKEGVIYFSMGATLKSVNFPPEVLDTLMSVFSELRQRVVMKWEGEKPLRGQPPNVRLENWLPQSNLLAHPNMKLFISHGGLFSFQESVVRGVPLIGIPFFGDQELNVQKIMNLGVGLHLPYKELTKDNLLKAIRKILGDASFQNKMKRLSNQAMDQLEHPLQRAAFWTEYIIRHKGAKHIQPASQDLGWLQLYSVDVISILFSLPISMLISFCYLGCKCCCGRKRSSKKISWKAKTKVKKN